MKLPRKRPRHPEVRAGESEREKAGAEGSEGAKTQTATPPQETRGKAAGENGLILR